MQVQGLRALPDVRARDGVAAVVVKPGIVSGFEAASRIASWARSRGMQVLYCISWALSASVLWKDKAKEST